MRKAIYFFSQLIVAMSHNSLGTAAFYRQKITITFFFFTSQIDGHLPIERKKNHSLFRKWKLLLFISYNGQLELEFLFIFYFGYLFYKLSTFQGAYLMKPKRIFREIVHHIFHIWKSPNSSERQNWIDSSCQTKYSNVRDQ